MSTYNLEVMQRWFDPNEVGRRSLDPGEVLFQQGDEVVNIYFVESGEIVAERYLANGQSLTFFRAGQNAAISEAAMFFSEQVFTAAATRPTVIRSIAKKSIQHRMDESDELRGALTSCLAGRYIDSLMYRELITVKSAEERLLSWLKWRLEYKPGELDLAGRLGTIGPELGLTKESIYRALASLEKSGAIQREGGKILLVDSHP